MSDKPDYLFWDSQPHYTLSQAVDLCVDREPGLATPERVSGKAQIIANRIQKELAPIAPGETMLHDDLLQKKRIEVVNPSTLFYSREDLKAWAEQTGQRPLMPFLFPEDRAKSSEQSDKATDLRSDTKANMLFTIGLLVESLREKSGPACRTDKGVAEAVEKTARLLGVSLDGISRSSIVSRIADAKKEIEYRQVEARQKT